MRFRSLPLVALAATILPVCVAAPATADTNPGGSGGDCVPSWGGSPGQHSFTAHIKTDPCGFKVQGAVLCLVTIESMDPPGTESTSQYYMYGPTRTKAGTTSEATCPSGEPIVSSGVAKYGIRYNNGNGWRNSVKDD